MTFYEEGKYGQVFYSYVRTQAGREQVNYVVDHAAKACHCDFFSSIRRGDDGRIYVCDLPGNLHTVSFYTEELRRGGVQIETEEAFQKAKELE